MGVAAIGGIVSGASGLLSGIGAAGSAEAQARAAAEGDRFQAEQEELLYREGIVKALQTDTSLTDKLSRSLSSIRAIRGGSGADVNSPSGNAIENAVFGLGGQDISREVSNIRLEAQQHLIASQYYWQAYGDALNAGSQAAGISIAGGALKGIAGLFG